MWDKCMLLERFVKESTIQRPKQQLNMKLCITFSSLTAISSFSSVSSITLKKSGAKIENGSTLELFQKTAPLFKSSLIIMFVLKRYLNGGHPVDMKRAPPWSRFGSTFFFQCTVRVIVEDRSCVCPTFPSPNTMKMAFPCFQPQHKRCNIFPWYNK